MSIKLNLHSGRSSEHPYCYECGDIEEHRAYGVYVDGEFYCAECGIKVAKKEIDNFCKNLKKGFDEYFIIDAELKVDNFSKSTIPMAINLWKKELNIK